MQSEESGTCSGQVRSDCKFDCRPEPFEFNDRGARRPKEVILKEMEEDEAKLVENRWPYMMGRVKFEKPVVKVDAVKNSE
jgi:hypothetical protein